MEKEQAVSNKTPLISVIVPVYKVEPFIHRCVDSILAQTYQNLEVILVDDGSPDRCGKICDEYAEKDSRIRVIHQENGGISAARNAGLEICTGDYVAFVDSDDYIELDMYEKLLTSTMEHGADICVCQWQYEDSNGRSAVDPKIIDQTLFCASSSIDLVRYCYRGPYEIITTVVVWNKLYRKSILEGIRFSGRTLEDEAFHTELFSKTLSVIVIPNLLYVYRENPQSLTKAAFGQKDIRFLDILQDRYSRYHTDPYMRHESLVRYVDIYIEYDLKARELALQMPNLTHYARCIWELIRGRECNMKFYMRTVFFLISPKLYHHLISIWKKRGK